MTSRRFMRPLNNATQLPSRVDPVCRRGRGPSAQACANTIGPGETPQADESAQDFRNLQRAWAAWRAPGSMRPLGRDGARLAFGAAAARMRDAEQAAQGAQE